MHRYCNSKQLYIYLTHLCIHPKKISGTSGKNHFYKMNGDVGMVGGL